jgi:probable F420-dependent oxidoreductase
MAFARRVEDSGFHTLVMPDHFGARLALAPALVLAAEATFGLRVGSLVYDNDFHHPALLAQEVASIDLLTDGRFEFGLGAGWLKSEYDAAGIAFDDGAVRVERMAEALSVIKALFRAEPVSHQGRFYRLTDLTGSAQPKQRPHPPVLIGGGGRRLLTLAAQEADIISVMPASRRDGSGLQETDASAEAFARKVGWVRDAAGDRFSAIELNTLVQAVVVTDHPREAAAPLAREYGTDIDQVLETPLLLIGSVAQIAETLERRRERFGISYITVFEKDLESLAKVIDRLAAVSAG